MLRAMARHRTGLFGLVLVVIVIGAVMLAPLLAQHDPNQIFAGPRFGDASWAFPLGTDQLGRDIFARVLYGGRLAFDVVGFVLGIALVSGIAIGVIAAFASRTVDSIILLLLDTIRSFPVIIFALAVIALTGPSLPSIIAVIAITSVPAYARVVRTQAKVIREQTYIIAERALGVSGFRLLTRHVIPNIIGPLVVLVSMDIPLVVTLEAGLSFLGMGVRPPTPSWGSILNDGYSHIQQSLWLVIAGGLPLVLTTLGFTFLGEALRDVVDPTGATRAGKT